VTSLSTGTRREQNKRATKQAIVDAVAQLLRQGADSALTAHQIADAAGISRRTLFNYFPTVDAIYSYPLHQVLDSMVESMGMASNSIPLLESIIQALKSDEVTQQLGQVAHFGAYVIGNEANGCFTANVNEWQQATMDVLEKLGHRYPQADSFSIRVLTHALLGAGQAAFDEWMEHIPANQNQSMDISPDLLATFHTLVTKAMHTLELGFNHFPLTNTCTSTSKDI